MNENSRTRHFLIEPILQSISEQMLKLGGVGDTSTNKHHQFNKPYLRRQNQRITSLLNVFDKHALFSADYIPLQNIITGQIFPRNVFESYRSFEETGSNLYKEFVEERLGPNRKISILDPIKKVKLETCKASTMKKKIKINDKIIELRGNCNLFARCALMQQQRDINMKEVIGEFELTTTPRSLFNPDGSLLNGSVNKADAVTEVLDKFQVKVHETMPSQAKCCVIDSMRIINEMNPKPRIIKTGRDLAMEFNRKVDQKALDSNLLVIVFDIYVLSHSLKGRTRKERKKIKNLI